MLNRVTLILFLSIISLPSQASTIRVIFDVPYTTADTRAQGNEEVDTVVEVPYQPEEGFFGSGEEPSSDDLKAATDKVTGEITLTIWQAYLAKKPSSNIVQKETAMRERIDDLVYDTSITHKVNSEEKKIVFALRGKINTNLVDQIAGYEPSEDDHKKAISMARKKILDKYIAQLDSSKISQIEKSKQRIQDRINDLVYDLSVRGNKVLSDRKIIQYNVKASVNDALFDKILFSFYEQNTTGEGSEFVFLILPRIQDEVTTFDNTITQKSGKAAGSTLEKQGNESMSDSGGGIEEYESTAQKQRQMSSNTTSGSTIKKTQKSTWRIANAQTVDAQINRFLTQAGFETIEFDAIVDECGSNKLSAAGVRKELVKSKDGTPTKTTTKNVNRAMKKCDIHLFGLGVMDIHSIRADRNTGGMRAQVKVTVNVQSYSKRFPKTVASMSENYDGIGVSQDAAIDQAIEKASRKVVDIILATLRTKGIR